MEMEIYQFILRVNTVRINVRNQPSFDIKLGFEFLFPDKEKMVEILIDAKPDTIDVKNINGTTPLALAADRGILMFLLERRRSKKVI